MLSILAGCPHRFRWLLQQRVATAFGHDQAKLLEPDTAGRTRIFEITIANQPRIELDVDRSTLRPLGIGIAAKGLTLRSTFRPSVAARRGIGSG
jgi:hypothetical protein